MAINKRREAGTRDKRQESLEQYEERNYMKNKENKKMFGHNTIKKKQQIMIKT